MKIEKISDNKIRCTVSKEDLEDREVTMEELIFGKDRAKELFQEMINQANEDVGFEINDHPIMVEAIPDESESVTFIITKVDGDGTSVESLNDLKEKLIGRMKNYDLKLEDFDNDAQAEKKAKKDINFDGTNMHYIYKFLELTDVIDLARRINMDYYGGSALYKYNDMYYLTLSVDKKYSDSMVAVLSLLNECAFGDGNAVAKDNYFREHYETIIEDRAIEKLAQI